MDRIILILLCTFSFACKDSSDTYYDNLPENGSDFEIAVKKMADLGSVDISGAYGALPGLRDDDKLFYHSKYYSINEDRLKLVFVVEVNGREVEELINQGKLDSIYISNSTEADAGKSEEWKQLLDDAR